MCVCECVSSLKLLPLLCSKYMLASTMMLLLLLCYSNYYVLQRVLHMHIEQAYTHTHTLVLIKDPRNFNNQIGANRETETFQSYCSVHGCWLSAIISHNTCDDYNIRKCVYYPEIITMKFMGQTIETECRHWLLVNMKIHSGTHCQRMEGSNIHIF